MDIKGRKNNKPLTAAIYFITISTEEREKYFGEINAEDYTMQLSHVGIIADILWHQIPVHSKEC
jgi:hypothetical protein